MHNAAMIETAAQCERWAGIKIVIAASFAPIHERNNINLGQLMGDHEILKRLQFCDSVFLNCSPKAPAAPVNKILLNLCLDISNSLSFLTFYIFSPKSE